MGKQQPELEVVRVPLGELHGYEGNAKRHTSEQIDAVRASIAEFGFVNPVLAWHDAEGRAVIVAGHARCEAARAEGLSEVPVVFVDHLGDEQRRALTLADNQTTMMTGWDPDALAAELDALADGFDMAGFGFDLDYGRGGVIDSLLGEGFVSSDFGETSDTYAVTLQVPKASEAAVRGFVAANGKAPLVEAVLGVCDGR